jgi:hypothetical protein
VKGGNALRRVRLPFHAEAKNNKLEGGLPSMREQIHRRRLADHALHIQFLETL